MTWSSWVQELLSKLDGPQSWSPARMRAEAEWRQIWCPPGTIRVRERLVSVERVKRRQWRQTEIAA